MILKGENSFLEIDVLSATRSLSADFWENNWLHCSIKGEFPGFLVNCSVTLRTDDFQRCFNDLQHLISFEKKNAFFLTLEEGLMINFILDDTGIIKITGYIIATDLTGCKLEFNFLTDISRVQKFAFEINSLITDYPIIGSP